MAEIKLPSVYRIDENNRNYTVSSPVLDLTEAEKTPQWYLDNLRYQLSFYNTLFKNINYGPAYDSEYGNQTYYTQPVNNMMRNMLYYLGKQPNLDYNFLTGNVGQPNLQAVWIKGQKIPQLIDYLLGSMRTRMANAKWSANPLSDRAKSQRSELIEKMKLKFLLKEEFSRLKQIGIEFNPANEEDFDAPEQIDAWVDQNYKDILAEIIPTIADGIWNDDQWIYKMPQAFKNCLIMGPCGIEHKVDKGRPYVRVPMPYQMIIDTRKDDDFNSYGRFAGVIDFMTPGEIFANNYGLNTEDRKEISEMARDNKLGSSWNTSRNLVWWNYSASNTDATVAVVTTYWLAPRDLGYKEYTNRFGTRKIVKTDPSNPKERGQYFIDDVYKATCIGNRWLVDYGPIDNVVESPTDKSKPLLPLRVFMPNMTGGETPSVTSRLRQLQDEVDAIRFKIREMIGNGKGKAYFIHGYKLGGTVDAKEVIDDLSSMKIHVLKSSGETIDASDMKGVVEQVDLTMDPMITALINYAQLIETTMEEIVNISKIALGQQNQYVGAGTQRASIGQSTLGLTRLFEEFMDFVQQNMMYACNVAKTLYCEPNNQVADFTIGEKAIKFLKLLPKYKFEDFEVVLTLNDVIDEAGRQRLIAIAQAMAQNGQITMLDFLNIETAKTYTEMKVVIEQTLKQKEVEAKRQQALQAMQAQAMQEQQMQAMNAQEALRQAGADKRTEETNNTKLRSVMIKEDSETNRMAAQMAQQHIIAEGQEGAITE